VVAARAVDRDRRPVDAELLAAIYAWMARAESARRSERVRAGLKRRRREGKPVGRQPGATDKRPRKRSGYVARWERERGGALSTPR
jgi:DNA invertase Pin-like site-specific DNA recombinase